MRFDLEYIHPLVRLFYCLILARTVQYLHIVESTDDSESVEAPVANPKPSNNLIL